MTGRTWCVWGRTWKARGSHTEPLPMGGQSGGRGSACNTPLAASLSRLPRARCRPETHGRTRHRAAPREADVPKKRVGSMRRGEARSSSGGHFQGRCRVPGSEHRVGSGGRAPRVPTAFPGLGWEAPGWFRAREGAGGQLALCESVTYCYFHRDSRRTERKGRPRRRQKTGLEPG